MPSFILKPDRDVDLYVEWSTVVDNATRFGTRDELASDYKGVTPERFARADETGTSCIPDGDWHFGSWADDGFIVYNVGRRVDEGPAFWLKRSDLLRYVQLGCYTDEAEALLTVITHEGEEAS